MRISIVTAGLLAGLGVASLTSPAAATSIGSSLAVAVPSGMLTKVRMRRSGRRVRPAIVANQVSPVRHQQFRFNQVTRGAPAGGRGGNGVTGSVAAPSGKD